MATTRVFTPWPLRRWIARLEDEHRDLPVRLRLVRRVVGPGLDRALPPDGLLVARDLAGGVVALRRAVLQLDVRVSFRL